MVLIPSAVAATRSPPRLFQSRPPRKPRVVKLSAQAVTDAIGHGPLVARPRFLTNCKVQEFDVLDRAVSTILTVFLLREALLIFVATFGTHIVPNAPIKFDRRIGVKDLKVERHETLVME